MSPLAGERSSRAGPSRTWRAIRWGLDRVLGARLRRELRYRALGGPPDDRRRWTGDDIDAFATVLRREVAEARERASPQALPSFGSRLMAELAILTVSADRTLRKCGVASDEAHRLVSDVGWRIYRRLLLAASLPARLVTRDPGRRLRYTIRLLLRFPFAAEGEPGYAVEVRRRGDDLHTDFTHCPPQTVARKLSRGMDDPEILEAFRESWCTYDWPGADIIAGDGRRGHYERTRTLSRGDSVCDMCWRAGAPDSVSLAGQRAE